MINSLLAMLLLGLWVPVTHDVPIEDLEYKIIEDVKDEVNEDPSDKHSCDTDEAVRPLPAGLPEPRREMTGKLPPRQQTLVRP